ncbi:MAG TPA: flagellar basal body protein [Sphingobium sp.]|uniref:flagellar basal body rod protein FlgB n=1 Tax=Sphingobium sp. TaxID=1912891 RepID=UPI002ED18B6D
MSSTTPPLMTGIERAMKHLAERQRIISENIANNDTPRYKAREVERPDFSDLLEAQNMRGGAPRVARPHIRLTGGMTALGAQPPASATNVVEDSGTSETKPDGNNVTLEDQLLKMGGVQADFTAMTNLYRKQLSLMKKAVGGRD